MASLNPRNVAEMLLEEYRGLEASPRNDEEFRMKNKIKEMLEDCRHDTSFIFEDDNELSFINTSDVSNVSLENGDMSDDDTSDDDTKEENFCTSGGVNIKYKTDAVRYWRSKTGKQRRSLKAVQNRYKKVKSETQLERWEKSLKSGGTRREKFQMMNKAVLEKFIEAKTNCLTIHDIDLQKWGVKAAETCGLSTFKASQSWVARFKLRNGIVSRKITKFVTKAQITNVNEINRQSEEFVKQVRKDIRRVGEQNTYNSDQSGFALEMRSGRTLHERGARKINKIVQRVNSTTHSYTVQPILNAKGEFLKPLLMVLPEPTGRFGPKVAKSLFQAPNVKVIATKSGKCTTAVLKEWYENCFLPQISCDSVILLDSYGGFDAATEGPSTSNSENELLAGHNMVTVRRIPKNTTGMVQPLDVYGFRPYKNLQRKFTENILLHGHDCQVGVRNNVIKIQSLVFNQIDSPRFHQMFRYGWYSSGYLDRHPDPFQTPVEYCFPSTLEVCSACEEIAFIRCSWCTEHLCFNDFFEKYHLCGNIVLE